MSAKKKTPDADTAGRKAGKGKSAGRTGGDKGSGPAKGASSYQDSKPGAYGDGKALCKNSRCRLRKASCAGFIACPGFKA